MVLWDNADGFNCLGGGLMGRLALLVGVVCTAAVGFIVILGRDFYFYYYSLGFYYFL